MSTQTNGKHAVPSHPKASGYFIVDAVIHAFNFDPANARVDIAKDTAALSYGMVKMTGDEDKVSAENWMIDWSGEQLAELMFMESDVAIGVHHTVPSFDYYWEGLVSNEKAFAMCAKWPDRVKFYGSFEPDDDYSRSAQLVDHLIKDCGAVGIKLYPEVRPGAGASVRPILLDSPNVAPIIEKCLEHDVPLGVHKIVPAGQGFQGTYHVTDVEVAARRYPDLQIEVVHSGFAFLDETAALLQRYKNVWANIELTSAYAVNIRRRFAEGLGILLMSAPDRVIYSSGACLWHRQTVIQSFLD